MKMKKMMLLMLMLLMLGTASMNAQVNIGSELAPKDGAALDLSQSGNLGLILPNVALNNTTHYQLGTPETQALDSYLPGTGTVVFNNGQGALQPAGIYAWDGTKWQISLGSTPIATYTLAATAATGGLIDPASTPNDTYPEGTPITVIASPDTDYGFDGWYESNLKIAGANATYNFNITSNRSLEARFAAILPGDYTTQTDCEKANYIWEDGQCIDNPCRFPAGYTYAKNKDNCELVMTSGLSESDYGYCEWVSFHGVYQCRYYRPNPCINSLTATACAAIKYPGTNENACFWKGICNVKTCDDMIEQTGCDDSVLGCRWYNGQCVKI